MQKQNKCNLSSVLCLTVLTLCLLPPVRVSAQKDQSQPCATGGMSCFSGEGSASSSPNDGFERKPTISGPSRVVTLLVRESHGGPFAHHWIELEGSEGPLTAIIYLTKNHCCVILFS